MVAGCAGQKDRYAAHEHALGLGSGPEARLGFAEAAARDGRAGDGVVYAAAVRWVASSPVLLEGSKPFSSNHFRQLSSCFSFKPQAFPPSFGLKIVGSALNFEARSIEVRG